MLFLFSFIFLFFYVVELFLFFYLYFFGSLVYDYFLFSLGGLDFSFSFILDYVSLSFFCCVSFISMIVFIYSILYMSGSVDMRRFLWLVFFFVLSMGLLVFSGNFLLFMVGWDGLGLVSFCLVIFYYNSFSLESGLVTVFSNRVGDVFFLLSFFFFSLSGIFGYDLSSFFYFSFCVFLFFGAITKSAQVPFSAWLPAAMAAPTPVSSLVHSSTLVTAGVYVMVRFNYMFTFFSGFFFGCFFVFTMVLAGLGAFVEKDFKKVVAMSTLSQLGMMTFTLSIGMWILAFLHMIIHAFFKSMLFLSTGSLMIHGSGSQESRFFGGSLYSYMSFLNFVVSGFCLSGFPFFIGFYSKDAIIFSSSLIGGLFIYFVFLVGCLFTVIYSFRLVKMAFVSFYKFGSYVSIEEGWLFFSVVIFLFFKCWVVGGGFYWFFLCFNLFYLSFFDLFMGLFLIFFGVLIFLLIKFFYGFLVFFMLIFFMRWSSSGGTSYFFNRLLFYKGEGSWMEVSGGRGFYSFLGFFNNFFVIFFNVGIGFLILVSFFNFFTMF